MSWYVVQVEDPSQAAAIAKTLDAKFENSQAETKTAPDGFESKSTSECIS